MIKPTVGRVVWYWRATADLKNDQPYAAIVTYVHGDSLVNLVAFSKSGNMEAHDDVSLRQPEDPEWITTPFCEWMPYQKAVASGAIPPVLHAGTNIKYERIQTCTLTVDSLEMASTLLRPARVYTLYVHPSAFLFAKKMLRRLGATVESDDSPYINLIRDERLQVSEWMLHGDSDTVGSEGC